MFRKIGIAGAVAAVIGASGLYTAISYGETAGRPAVSHAGVVERTDQSETVGNRICPVTDEKISKKTEVTYKFKGKVYSFCCRACIDEFKKDPDKYITKIKNANKRKE